MIVPRACDLCLRTIPTELVQFEVVRGVLASRSSLQWTIQPAIAGVRLTTICRECAGYLQSGIAHLRGHYTSVREAADSEAQAS
ncbi:MAG: hypothetical protein O3B31_08085 [Chloroflexi bacterium]|nr:hypothetical protein [Chloroflexota bacterium]MDA1003292.1 hypothetical protein [Chloroflexota bacterium]